MVDGYRRRRSQLGVPHPRVHPPNGLFSQRKMTAYWPRIRWGSTFGLTTVLANRFPMSGAQVPKLRDNLKAIQSAPICAAVNRLDLEERILFREFDGDIRPSNGRL